MEVISDLWDLDKFYDNIDLTILIAAGRGSCYPLRNLALSLQLYLSPRLLRASGCIDSGIVGYNGVLAGCAQAKNFSKAMLLDIIDHAHVVHPGADISVYVDDIGTVSKGVSEDKAVNVGLGAAIFLKNSFRFS